MRTLYWTALSLFQVTEPRNMDASSSSSPIHHRHPAFFTCRGWRPCRRGSNAASEKQVGYPLMSDAVALRLTSPQSSRCQIEAESCSSSPLQEPPPQPHPTLPASNPAALGDLGTHAGLGSSQRLCDNWKCIGSERGCLIYSICLNYISFTSKKNVFDWIEQNQYFCTPKLLSPKSYPLTGLWLATLVQYIWFPALFLLSQTRKTSVWKGPSVQALGFI